MQDIEQIVKEILSAVFKVSSSSSIESLSMATETSWDSMKQLTLITALENEFDIFIEAAEAANLTSYEIIVKFVSNHSEMD